jgi:anti-sigma regulatory factor (Ser/Thr protein kinase)
MELSYELESDDFAPSAARRAVERDLGERISLTTLTTVRTVVSELVTNSVQHAPSGAAICLRLDLADDGRVRGEVEDDGHGVAAIRAGHAAGPVAGLKLVDALSSAWGVEDDSTLVWFEVAPEP